MTKTINITIRFFSQWHCGSGTSAGADVDELVVKDNNGMPYIPGKTLKGLIREATEDYVSFSSQSEALGTLLAETFGKELGETPEQTAGCAHFGNAVLEGTEYEAIVENHAQQYMYDKITTTAIDDDGIAKDHSLRSMEVVLPCTLYASITGVPENLADILSESFGMIKRMGQKRNRGLGRCEIKEGGKI
ncbi:RAMP superfamily CRISPR-associated protein [uncultured Prevotella sp.]|uniref:RAMP superfamily CRISPR-associated protein n=1 Tax=uncultured Prevotella sp. TaxID=159272 RepID=UPI002599BCB2|nr:RAMP superfamily CRISPR-associated protein [uncultured Prevotella sp.]